MFSDTPRVTAHRSVINTKEGDDAELYCDYETSTESRVVWLKDQKQLLFGNARDTRPKYTLISKGGENGKNTSILVVTKVSEKDLGDYECSVRNNMGSENVTIELTYVPEPPHLHKMEQSDDNVVVTHWHIRSLQPLTEVTLNYKLQEVRICHIRRMLFLLQFNNHFSSFFHAIIS